VRRGIERRAALGRAWPRGDLTLVEVHPVGAAIRPPLLLPERHRLFDSVDRFTARFEGVVAMCCAGRNADRGVPDGELADSVDRGDPYTRMLGHDALEHALHLFVCEALVRFVVESGDLLSVRMITNDSMEDTDAAGSWMLDRFSDLVE